MGPRALVLARGLGLFSALPAPSTFLPGPDLSDVVRPVLSRSVDPMPANLDWCPPRPWSAP